MSMMQIARNITTNELANAVRYGYLRGPDGRFRNPYNHGCRKNCTDFIIRGYTDDEEIAWPPLHQVANQICCHDIGWFIFTINKAVLFLFLSLAMNGNSSRQQLLYSLIAFQVPFAFVNEHPLVIQKYKQTQQFVICTVEIMGQKKKS